MKTKLFTRSAFLGILMTLVMVLGVQGITDALTLSKTSGDLVSKPIGGNPTFDITFSVRLESNSTRIYNSLGRQVDEYKHTIDSSGYLVTYIGSNARRWISSTLSDANTINTSQTYNVTSLTGSPTLKVRLPTDRSNVTSFGTILATSPNTPLYVTGGNGSTVVDSQNRTVYVETAHDSDGTYKYAIAKANPVAPYTSNAPQRYAYNDEQIKITSNLTTPSGGTSPNVIMLHGGKTYQLTGAFSTGTEINTDGYILKERDRNLGIPSSITLRITPTNAAGTYTITIADHRATERLPTDDSFGDYPNPRPVSNPITFTLYTTGGTGDRDPADSVTVGPDDRTKSTSLQTYQINTLYTVRNAALEAVQNPTVLLAYDVLEGPGTLYRGQYDKPTGTPGTSLTTSAGANVFLYLNRGDSRIRVYIDGGHPEDGATISFYYTGTDRRTTTGNNTNQTNQNNQVTGRGTLRIVPSGSGTTRNITVNALNAAGLPQSGISVLLNVNNGATLSRTSGGTPFTSTLTLPATAGDYTLTATTTADYAGATETITVTLPGNLGLSLVGQQVNGSQTVRVTARTAGGTLVTTPVLVRLTGAGTSRTVNVTGSQDVPIVLPTVSGTLIATADGYNDGSVVLPARSTIPTIPGTGTDTAGVADSLEIDGSRTRDGTLAQATQLRVRVLDANDRGVSGVAVTFQVLAPGRGTFAGARGSGRAIRLDTDRDGDARVSFTPTSAGDVIVEAKAAGVRSAVTFIIEVGGATGDQGTGTDRESDTTAPQTYSVGDKIPISLEDTLSFTSPRTLNGITYTCVGSGPCVVSYGLVTKGEIQAAPAKTTPQQEYEVGDKISISLEDTLRFTGRHTVNGTIYTCVGPGECVVSYGLVTKGQIRVSAASTTTTRSTTDMNPEVLLSAERRPSMVWVNGGTIYSLIGADIQEFAPSVENVMDIAVNGNKLYWTEQTGENTGTINSMNLDGTGAKELVSIYAVPRGIAVDAVAKRLYWTNSQGWIQSSNLEGTARRNVVSGGLEDPMGIAVGTGWVYWTQGNGRVQAVNLTGTKTVRNISTGTNPADDVAVFESKVYWTQMTGKNAGTINAANLDGTDAKQLVSIQAVPRGIVVDPVAERLYWANSQGWIQSSNLEGKARRNVAKGLGSPGGIALSANLKASTTTPAKNATTTADRSKYDVNGDGAVDDVDAGLIIGSMGTTTAKYDVNGDGSVTFTDLQLVLNNRDAGAAAAPMRFGMKLTAEQIANIQEQIEVFIATGDRSPDAMRTLIYLQQLIVMARPEKTQLLANYPNPFNPETWIPYELATDTDVKLTIYNTQGVVIRVLQLGQQSAGYYTDRERAAYWDGRNALGEQVASGIYFYQLETDDMSSLRKMVILK